MSQQEPSVINNSSKVISDCSAPGEINQIACSMYERSLWKKRIRRYFSSGTFYIKQWPQFSMNLIVVTLKSSSYSVYSNWIWSRVSKRERMKMLSDSI